MEPTTPPDAGQPPYAEMAEGARDFRLDEVLTVITGTNFLDTQSDPDPNAFTRRIGDLTNFMTREEGAETHQLPRLADEVRESVLAEHPELGVFIADMPAEPPDDASAAEEAAFDAAHKAWYQKIRAELETRMDEPIALTPIPPEAHTHIDSQDEFRAMGGTVIDSAGALQDLLENGPQPGPKAEATASNSAQASATDPNIDASFQAIVEGFGDEGKPLADASDENQYAFDKAKTTIEGWVASDLASGNPERREAAEALSAAIRGLGANRRTALNSMLHAVETRLADYAQPDSAQSGNEAAVHELRGIRETLLRELDRV